jgi:hypothetical protein
MSFAPNLATLNVPMTLILSSLSISEVEAVPLG